MEDKKYKKNYWIELEDGSFVTLNAPDDGSACIWLFENKIKYERIFTTRPFYRYQQVKTIALN